MEFEGWPKALTWSRLRDKHLIAQIVALHYSLDWLRMRLEVLAETFSSTSQAKQGQPAEVGLLLTQMNHPRAIFHVTRYREV